MSDDGDDNHNDDGDHITHEIIIMRYNTQNEMTTSL